MSVSTNNKGSLDLHGAMGIPTQASNERWQPSRAGLINVWRYWDETFRFHNGRLLLLGANGSGKSLGLELLLPYLLDANASPSRLTSATKARGGLYDRMMAGYTNTNRAGFLWVEFTRGEYTFTIGTRLRASQSTRKVEADFFTTTQRIHEDLHLFDEQRTPLTVKQLKEVIGTHGAVHNSAKEHRRAVRNVLFPEFTEDRYDALITALLAMRKEKLSQDLDLKKMSDTLSQALIPLEEHDLATVAEGFERLDRRRADLETQEIELQVIKRLATQRKRYAQHVCAQVASDVRKAETDRDAVTRRLREATSKHDEAKVSLDETQTRVDTEKQTLLKTESGIDALQGSEAYRHGAQLVDLQHTAGNLKRRQAQEESEYQRQEGKVTAQSTRQEDDKHRCEQHRSHSQNAQHAVRIQAQSVGADVLFDDSSPIETDTAQSVNSQISLLNAWITTRRADIAAVDAACQTVASHTETRNRAYVEVEDETLELEEKRQTHEDALQAHTDAEAQFRADTNDWANSCVSSGAERTNGALPEELTVTAVHERMRTLEQTIQREHTIEKRDLEQQRTQLTLQREKLDSERNDLQQHRLQVPEAPPWRDARSADDKHSEGAAFWQFLEPIQGMNNDQIDRLEAALLGAGFLDAWVASDGQCHLPDKMADIVLHTGPSTQRSLADVLRPSLDEQSALNHDTLMTVLSAIALQDTTLNTNAQTQTQTQNTGVAIGLDGSFRLGTAVGRGQIQPACYLGASARERRRMARLQSIETELETLAVETSKIDDQLSLLHVLSEAVANEFRAMPDGVSVRDAQESVRVTKELALAVETRVNRLRTRLHLAEQEVKTATRALTTLAAQTSLPVDVAALKEVATTADELASLCNQWAQHSQNLTDAKHKLAATQEQLQEALHEAGVAKQRVLEVTNEATQAQTKFETLNAALGSDYQQLLAELDTLKEQKSTLRESIDRAQQSLQKLNSQLGGLNATMTQADSDRKRSEENRQHFHEQFRQLDADRLLADTGLSIDVSTEGLSAVLSAARLLTQSLPTQTLDASTLNSLAAKQQEALHQARAQLGGHIDLDDHQNQNNWWVLKALVGSIRMSIPELSTQLSTQLEAGRGELAADEVALFERTLAGSIRQSLANRIRQTTQLVEQINNQLEQVRTAAGAVSVKLRWHVDEQQADAVQRARNLLLKDPASLTADERLSLQDFVRARVEQARADLEANAPWHERLHESLDYRAWHRFSLQVAHRDWEGFKPATEKLMSQLSTGERSIVLHLPMLASIAAHYTPASGNSECPRLILLDELFAGVDKANRAQLFATFTAWRMDAVFTSDHEWCDYATLDGIAIHVLHPSTGDEPVTSTRFIWDGKSRRPGDEPEAVH